MRTYPKMEQLESCHRSQVASSMEWSAATEKEEERTKELEPSPATVRSSTSTSSFSSSFSSARRRTPRRAAARAALRGSPPAAAPVARAASCSARRPLTGPLSVQEGALCRMLEAAARGEHGTMHRLLDGGLDIDALLESVSTGGKMQATALWRHHNAIEGAAIHAPRDNSDVSAEAKSRSDNGFVGGVASSQTGEIIDGAAAWDSFLTVGVMVQDSAVMAQ